MNICGRSRAALEAGGLNKRGFMPVRVFSEEEKKEIKEKMFTQGMELIKEYGLTHTSVSKITERAGIGKSTFYNFFPSKEMFVIELMRYERQKAMDYLNELLRGRDKMTKEEAKGFLKIVIFHQDSIYQYLSEEDLDTLYPAMVESGQIESDLNSDTPQFLLDHMEEADPKADPRVFLNFLRIMALAVSQKEALQQETLNETLELIFEAMFRYIFTE